MIVPLVRDSAVACPLVMHPPEPWVYRVVRVCFRAKQPRHAVLFVHRGGVDAAGFHRSQTRTCVPLVAATIRTVETPVSVSGVCNPCALT